MGLTEFPDETTRFDSTMDHIETEITKLTSGPKARTAYQGAANEIQRIRDKRLFEYKSAKHRPYYARIDFTPSDSDRTQTGYLGIYTIGHDLVYSWTSPYAELYYKNPQELAKFTANEKVISGNIALKRRYQIDNSTLVDVEHVFPNLRDMASESATSDLDGAFMFKRLSKGDRSGPEVSIETLQPDQYEQIASAEEEIMLIQGVAGSGKSLVGLHRLAFLLSPANGRSRKINPARVVFFGPTMTFLNQISGFLPELGVQNVRHELVKDWLVNQLSSKIYLQDKQPLLEKLLRQGSNQWESLRRSAKRKGSLLMASCIESYISSRRKEFIKAVRPIDIKLNTDTTVQIDIKTARRLVKTLPTSPLNSQRETLISRFSEVLWRRYEQNEPWRSSRTLPANRKQFDDRSVSDISEQVDSFWPRLDFRTAYRSLLSNSYALSKASKGRIDELESNLLASSLPGRPTVFNEEDIGPLCFTDNLINALPNAQFDHVVIDEAQEVSPIAMAFIKTHNLNGGFTILADLQQSLFPHGFERWNEILPLFRKTSVTRTPVARTSYRATSELTRFSNRILRQASSTASSAVPYPRHGDEPSLRGHMSYDSMAKAIGDDINSLRNQGMKTIGVLCKSTSDATKLHRIVRNQGLTNISLLNKEESEVTDVTVAPIHMTRGLEFDAVILSGVTKEHYPETPLHSRLLYIGVSRAAHRLSIHWFGLPAAQIGYRPGR